MNSTKRMVESGILIAIALILSFIQPFQLPFGGGITIASMLPIIIISYRHGVKWGIFTGLVYSLLQMLIGFQTVSALFLPGSEQTLLNAILIIIIDYIIAYSVLGLGGMFKNKIKNPAIALCLGTIVVLFIRFVCHFISGFIFYGTYAEWFFTQEGFYAIGNTILTSFSGQGLAAVYSLFYNSLYMIPEIIITSVAALIVGNIPAITGVKKTRATTNN